MMIFLLVVKNNIFGNGKTSAGHRETMTATLTFSEFSDVESIVHISIKTHFSHLERFFSTFFRETKINFRAKFAQNPQKKSALRPLSEEGRALLGVSGEHISENEGRPKSPDWD